MGVIVNVTPKETKLQAKRTVDIGVDSKIKNGQSKIFEVKLPRTKVRGF